MKTYDFPEGFLWGAATAGHQVEGGNVNTESWVLEHLPGTPYADPSGDACDHYHRYPSDIAMLAELGFNSYRFSIEWARIEPEEGEFSQAALDHYRRMLASCHENGIRPVVTFHHFISPRWLMPGGGWLDRRTPDRFARYCERAVRHLGDLVSVACTVNEPNIPMLLSKMLPVPMEAQPWWKTAADAFGVAPENLGLWQFSTNPRMKDIILEAHRKAFEVLHSGPGDFPVGLTIALPDIQEGEGGAERTKEFRRDLADVYLEPLSDDDFVGVQNYGRMLVGENGLIHPTSDVEQNDMGEEFFPQGLEGAVRHAAAVSGIPVYVTENGYSTENDARRLAFFQGALPALVRAMESGVDVRGYLCWSSLDNFEWVGGYGPKMGIIGVERGTQERTPKPSGRWLGNVAKANRLQWDEPAGPCRPGEN